MWSSGGVHLWEKELTWKLESARKPVEVHPGNFIYYKLLGFKFLHEFCGHNFSYYLFHTDRDLDTKCQNTYLDQVILEFFPVCLYFRQKGLSCSFYTFKESYLILNILNL
jgi:hypothetical protein